MVVKPSLFVAEVYLETLKCKLRCEENLMPNVGGYFVENFVATIYHYLQYAYYKCKSTAEDLNRQTFPAAEHVFCCDLWSVNDGRRAVPCAYSYFLFKPEDEVMKQNLLYYKAYSQQWGLQPQHFTPRTVTATHFCKTSTFTH